MLQYINVSPLLLTETAKNQSLEPVLHTSPHYKVGNSIICLVMYSSLKAVVGPEYQALFTLQRSDVSRDPSFCPKLNRNPWYNIPRGSWC